MTSTLRFGLAYDVLAPDVELAEHSSKLLQGAELAEESAMTRCGSGRPTATSRGTGTARRR